MTFSARNSKKSGEQRTKQRPQRPKVRTLKRPKQVSFHVVAQEEQVTTPLEVEHHSPQVDEHSQEVVAEDVSTAIVAPNTSEKRRRTPQETALPLMKMKDAYKKNPEENSYEVEQVLDMRFTGKKHKTKEYLIRWKGYSSAHDSWIKEAGLDLSIEKYDLSKELRKKLNT